MKPKVLVSSSVFMNTSIIESLKELLHGLHTNAPLLHRLGRRSSTMRTACAELKLSSKSSSRGRRLRPVGFVRWPPSRYRSPFCHSQRVVAPRERHRLQVLHGWRGQAQRFAVSHVRCPIDGLLCWYRKASEGTRPCFKVGARLGSNTGHHDRGAHRDGALTDDVGERHGRATMRVRFAPATFQWGGSSRDGVLPGKACHGLLRSGRNRCARLHAFHLPDNRKPLLSHLTVILFCGHSTTRQSLLVNLGGQVADA